MVIHKVYILGALFCFVCLSGRFILSVFIYKVYIIFILLLLLFLFCLFACLSGRFV